jgi:hypothetical protein
MTTGWLLLAVLIPSMCAAQQQWPVIAPVERTYHVQLPAANPGVELTIKSRTGEPSYKIECGTKDSAIKDFDYSGDFECRLVSLYEPMTYSTLFTENPKQDRDWESRARFFSNELTKPCGEIPDFGDVRSFRLRGMKIVLSISNIVFGEQGKDRSLKSFDFRISTEDDPGATTAITQPPIVNPRWKKAPCTLDASTSVHFGSPTTN